MRGNLQENQGFIDDVRAGYNAGGQAVVSAGYQIPPYRQTQNYVHAVLAHYEQLAGIQ